MEYFQKFVTNTNYKNNKKKSKNHVDDMNRNNRSSSSSILITYRDKIWNNKLLPYLLGIPHQQHEDHNNDNNDKVNIKTISSSSFSQHNNNNEDSNKMESVKSNKTSHPTKPLTSSYQRLLHYGYDMLWYGIENTYDHVYDVFVSNLYDRTKYQFSLQFIKDDMEYMDTKQNISFHQDIVLQRKPPDEQDVDEKGKEESESHHDQVMNAIINGTSRTKFMLPSFALWNMTVPSRILSSILPVYHSLLSNSSKITGKESVLMIMKEPATLIVALIIMTLLYRQYRIRKRRQQQQQETNSREQSMRMMASNRQQHHVATRVRNDISSMQRYSSIPSSYVMNGSSIQHGSSSNVIQHHHPKSPKRKRQNSHDLFRDYDEQDGIDEFFGHQQNYNQHHHNISRHMSGSISIDDMINTSNHSNNPRKQSSSFDNNSNHNKSRSGSQDNNNKYDNNRPRPILTSMTTGSSKSLTSSWNLMMSLHSTPTNNNNNYYLNNTLGPIRYYGPNRHHIQYMTVTPPPHWDIVSKNLFLTTIKQWKLQRKITLSLMKPYFSNTDGKNNKNNNLDTFYDMIDESGVLLQDFYFDGGREEKKEDGISSGAVPFVTSITIQENIVQSNKLSKQRKKDLQANTIELPISSISLHPKVPAGGVLELYAKPSPFFGVVPPYDINWKMEHTFSSAHAAAQFQMDLLGLQLLWPTIYNMYQAFAIVHKGSIAYDGNEPVMLHNNNSDPNTTDTNNSSNDEGDNNVNAEKKKESKDEAGSSSNENNIRTDIKDGSNNVVTIEESGIAWDDLMRCFGTSFPSIKQRLEALWWIELTGDTDNNVLRPQHEASTPRNRKDTLSSFENDTKKVPPTATSTPSPTDLPTTATSSGTTGSSRGRGESSFLSSPYVHKRLLLGPLDFFRLFVPVLPKTAIPLMESSRYRVEKLLRWRKRIARASVLVQSYTRARIIANQGWKIGIHKNTNNKKDYIKYRLAYDDNIDNKIHDSSVKNEYYEPTVSRDVFCMVRGTTTSKTRNTTTRKQTKRKIKEFEGDDDDDNDAASQESHGSPFEEFWQRFNFSKYLQSNTIDNQYYCNDAMSSYQGFTLVGMHLFHWPADNINLPLHYTINPVKSIPSLLDMIQKNPDVQFYVHSVYLVQRRAAVIKVFVRSLPHGIDPKFDKAVDRFFHGDVELRKRKLEMLLQLGIDSSVMSWTARLVLWFFTLLLRLTLLDRTIISQNSATFDDRTPIPAINLTLLGENYHFGGSLQEENSSLPTNYVASSVCMDSCKRNCYAARVVLGFIMGGYISDQVLDVSYNLAGEDDTELPERILCTSRFVRMSFEHKLSMNSVVSNGLSKPVIHDDTDTESTTQRRSTGIPSLLFKVFVTDPFVATTTAIVQTMNSDDTVSSPRSFILSPNRKRSPLRPKTNKLFSRNKKSNNKAERASFVITTDPFEQAVNELIRILDSIRVPVRKEQIASLDLKRIAPTTLTERQLMSDEVDLGTKTEDIVQMSVLRRVSRDDIQRYFIASNCDLKTAAVRIVESAAWRGMLFPIDIRTCRIELQNGQFFQQGNDKEGNPVFYFRSTLLGPWRKDENAVIAAVLHRLETSLRMFEKTNPKVRCTLIVVMGKPYMRKKKELQQAKVMDDENIKEKKSSDGTCSVRTGHHTAVTASSTAISSAETAQGTMTAATDGAETVVDDGDGFEAAAQAASINNPRIPPDEQWYTHANKSLLVRLIGILMLHYPERLNKVLVVVGHGNKSFIRSSVGGVLSLVSIIPAARTREKVKFLNRYRDLQTYVAQSELVTLVGGIQPASMDQFECS